MKNEAFCIICYKSNNLINYHSHCGIFKIHKKCLGLWLTQSNYQCLICRKNLKPQLIYSSNNRRTQEMSSIIEQHNVYHIHHPISIVQFSYTLLNTVAMFLICAIIYNITMDYILLIELHEYN